MNHLAWVFALALMVGLTRSEGADAAIEELREEPKSAMRVLVDRVDELLGGTRTDDNRTSSTLRLSSSDQISRLTSSHPEFNVDFNLKLGLVTRWQQELQSWFQGDLRKLEKDVDFYRDEGQTHGPARADQPKREALAPPKDPWRFVIEKHFTLALHPGFWIHARARKDLETESFVHSFSSEAGWSLNNKWESNVMLSSTMRLAPRWVFSFGNQVQWLISDKSFTTSHGPSVSYIPGSNQVASLGCSIGTAVVDKKTWFADSYSINGAYRIQAWRDWIYASAYPFLGFGRSQHFVGDPGINVSLEIFY